ncbi:MAG TPA: hypothetical protein VLK58_22255, partial [Conexibacter sp.]|nr:hypothetical protein [Conexibacter sp.]
AGAVTKFLNDFMENESESLDIERERHRFVAMADALHDVLGGRPFVKANYGPTPLVELEAAMVAAARVLDDHGRLGTPTALWIEDPILIDRSTGGTNTRSMLAGRINRAYELLAPA